MTYIPDALRRLVRERGRNCCEYCLINEAYTIKRHEIDHIRAEKHLGETVEPNLCLSCHDCNRHKGTDLTTFDPETNENVSLFHPRLDRWSDHFKLDGAIIKPLTPQGRATVRLLSFNDDKRVLERELLIEQGRYP
jgi:HNH endonuclease